MEDIKSIIKKTSIRAHFAIALTCIKQEFRREGLQGESSVRLILDRYAQFTNSLKLDVWEDEIYHYAPGGDFHLSSINKRFDSAKAIIKSLEKTNSKYTSYYSESNRSTWYQGVQLPIYEESIYEEMLIFYELLNKRIIELLNLTKEIAMADMYCSTGKYSESSLRPTLKVINTCDSEFDFMKIMNKYPFAEEGGWGTAFEFKSFMK